MIWIGQLLSAVIHTTNRKARSLVLAYVIAVPGLVWLLATLSRFGHGDMVPWFMVPISIMGVVWLTGWARITRGGPVNGWYGRASLTAGDPLLALLATTPLHVRLIICGVPLLVALYTWLVPMNTHPGLIMGLVLSVMGMIVFSGSLETTWPWAKWGRLISIGATIVITFLFFQGASFKILGANPLDILPDAQTLHEGGKSAKEYYEVFREGQAVASPKQAMRTTEGRIEVAKLHVENNSMSDWELKNINRLARGLSVLPRPTPVPTAPREYTKAQRHIVPDKLVNRDGSFQLTVLNAKSGWTKISLSSIYQKPCFIEWLEGSGQASAWCVRDNGDRLDPETFPLEWVEGETVGFWSGKNMEGWMRIYPRQ